MNAVTYRVEDNMNPAIPLAAKVLLTPEEEPRISRLSFNRHVKRFKREIENLKKLKGCKFIVPLYDSQPNNIQPFFVMKLCDGSLQDELAKIPLPMHMILNVLLDVCEGLQEIHDHEVFHRDFKPANILKYEGRWVLADFGMSLMGGDGGLVTVPDSFPGTIPYTPPEVMYNEPDTIGPAADIFSLGVTLKAMFTGNTILEAKASDLLPGRINIKIKRQIKLFDKFIEKMTNMESKNRPQSIGDVAKKIEEIFEEVNKIEGKKKKILFSKPHRERLKSIIRKEQKKIISVNKGRAEKSAKIIEYKSQQEVSNISKDISKFSTLDLIEKRSPALIKKLDEHSRRLDFVEQFGLSIKPEDYINRGFNLINKNKYEPALEAFENVIGLEPDNFRAWLGKGMALNKLGKHEESLKVSEKLIELNPGEAVAWNSKSASLINLNRFEEALTASEEAIKRMPHYANAWDNKGTALIGLKRYDEGALKALMEAVNLDSRIDDAWYNLACIFSVNEDRENMLTCLEKAIELSAEYKEEARKDKDLKEYWEDEEFKKITS